MNVDISQQRFFYDNTDNKNQQYCDQINLVGRQSEEGLDKVFPSSRQVVDCRESCWNKLSKLL